MVDTAAPMSKELHCLAGAVYFEARGEPLDGQLAVAQVIVNRTQDGRFPRSYCGVVAQPGQFSFMHGRSMPRVPTGTAAWKRAVAIARIAHQGLWDSPASDAVFFHNRSVRPSWSAAKTRLARIDAHTFYK
jgi:spore germination cell wall hydrolase CwlJ-like protein